MTFACEISGVVGDRFKICPQMIHQFYEPAVPVLTDLLITKDRFCAEWWGFCASPVYEHIDVEEVKKNILATKPVSLSKDDYIDKMYAEIAADTNPRQTLTAMHLSDIHIDFDYAVGTIANCNEYLCCRESVGYPKKESDLAAGEWGSTDCDIPVKTFQSMLDYVSSEIDLDMIFWTGDNAAHDIWSNTAAETVNYTVTVSKMIKEAFNEKDVAVFPI